MTAPIDLFHALSKETNKLVTAKYSTSFYKAVQFLQAEIRHAIYDIYGFVRLADEIVDTFHDYDKQHLLNTFSQSYEQALHDGLSINPVIHGFCKTKLKYGIPNHLVDAFLESMRMDLGAIQNLSHDQYQAYIFGSAEVVGLMCLKVFVQGNESEYERLKPYAQAFGAALQKVNFLRDMSQDYNCLKRTYFPQIDFSTFTEADKRRIETEIADDFKQGLKGIKQLPISSRPAVYLAYLFYNHLLKQIQRTQAQKLMHQRISVPKYIKAMMYFNVFIHQRLKLI